MVGEPANKDGYRFTPGCCCSPVASGCYIGGDDFDRANSTDLGSDWTESVASSGWAIQSNVLITTVPHDLVLFNTEHPNQAPSMLAWADVLGDYDGDQLRVVICYEDDDNYLFAELETHSDCGWLRAYQRVGGDTVLLRQTPIRSNFTNKWVTLLACYDPEEERFEARVESPSFEWRAVAEEVTASGTYAGLATGDLNGQASFDDFEFWEEQTPEEPECPTCRKGQWSCVIGTDDFNRADNTDLGCEWSELVASGDFQIFSYELITSVPYNVVQYLVPHPEGLPNTWAKARVKGMSNGDQLRVLIAFSDWYNYLFVQLTVHDDCGLLSLWQRAAGILTQLGNDIPVKGAVTNQWHTLEACYQMATSSLDGTLFGKVTPYSGAAVSHAELVEADGAYAGLASGFMSSLVYFDDFEYEELHSEEHPECRKCTVIDTCVIYTDNFSTDTLDCFWEIVTGSPVITSSYPTQMKFSDAGLVLCKLPHPDVDVPSLQWVSCMMQILLSTPKVGTIAKGQVYVGWESASEHHYVDVEIEITRVVDLGTVQAVCWVRCYKVAGGTPTQIGSSSYTTFWWPTYLGGVNVWVKVCYTGSEVRAQVSTSGAGYDVETWVTTDSGGRYVGIGASQLIAGATLAFDDFRFERHQAVGWEQCRTCEEEKSCGACLYDRGPQMIRITLQGFANTPDLPICATCDHMNGSEVVTNVVDCMAWIEDFRCDEHVDIQYPICCWTKHGWRIPEMYEHRFDEIHVGVILWQCDDGSYEVRGVVQYRCNGINSETLFYALSVGADKPDCDNWYRLELPYVGCLGDITGTGGCKTCDHENTSMLITTI